MTLVDSSVWIDYFRGASTPQSEWLDRQVSDGNSTVAVGNLIIAEVLQGFRSEKQAREAAAAFDLVEYVDLGGRALAIEAARNYRRLRAKGVSVRSTIDCLIATYCIENRIALLHSDRDFDMLAWHLALRVVTME